MLLGWDVLKQRFPNSAPWTTSGPRDLLKWSANPHTNQYFVLRGALKYLKWSANLKSLGTNVLEHRPREIGRAWQWGELEKIPRFKLVNFFSVFQNGLAFLGRIGKTSLAEFPEIYD
jgi:hypothetical protein